VTKRERELVVELLRCVADSDNDDVYTTGQAQDYPDTIIYWACSARWAVSDEHGHDLVAFTDRCEHNRFDRLEAAARIEEGSYP
jgi:hypothetical protein